MLFQQRIDFEPVEAGSIVVKIDLTSTLWTTIESQADGEEESVTASRQFPSRVLRSDNKRFTLAFAGVAPAFTSAETSRKYRLRWRIEPDTQQPRSGTDEDSVMVPVNQPIRFVNNLLGCDDQSHTTTVQTRLEFNISTNTLSTSWFIIPVRSSWWDFVKRVPGVALCFSPQDDLSITMGAFGV